MDSSSKELTLTCFGKLKTGDYFHTTNNPPIWSDSFVWRKNTGLRNGYNCYVSNGPVEYCGINSQFGDDIEVWKIM